MTPKGLASGAVGVACAWMALIAAGPATGQATAPAPKAKGQAARPAQVSKAKPKPADVHGADALTLRDGKTLLGQIHDPSPRGSYLVIVRRAWAEANLPDWYARWEKGEGNASLQAEMQRRDRLVVWRRDRMANPSASDRISGWLDRQLAKPPGPAEPSTLMVVRLNRTNDVKAVDRRGMAAARSLRLGWQLGFKDVETMPLADLKDALAGRGLLPNGESPIALDALLPQGLEPESQWLIRRAATEVLNDEGLRFVRHGNTVISEPVPGQPPDPANAASLVSGTLKDLLGDPSGDPVSAKLRDVEARGRVGAMITRLDLAPDMESVTVESALYVRHPNGQWARALVRAGTVRTGDVAPGAIEAIADDPQVKSAFSLIDSIGFGVTAEMKRKSLAVGATTKRALGLARSALARELSSVAVPLDEGRPNPDAPARP